MITFLRGSLVEKRISPPPAAAVLDVGGVGYELFIPLSTYDALPREGAECRLLAHDYVREDAHLLFGFATAKERELFLLLQGVSGVGPKIALSVLSGAATSRLLAALADGDAKFMAKFPGIGKRTAERICLELKGKINPLEAAAADDTVAGASGATPNSVLRDATLALVQLGQSEEAAFKRVREVAARPDAPQDVSSLIRLALSAK